jgi:hypothetical protein
MWGHGPPHPPASRSRARDVASCGSVSRSSRPSTNHSACSGGRGGAGRKCWRVRRFRPQWQAGHGTGAKQPPLPPPAPSPWSPPGAVLQSPTASVYGAQARQSAAAQPQPSSGHTNMCPPPQATPTPLVSHTSCPLGNHMHVLRAWQGPGMGCQEGCPRPAPHTQHTCRTSMSWPSAVSPIIMSRTPSRACRVATAEQFS